jgi:N-acetylglucosamine-6-phosphate deacetylase
VRVTGQLAETSAPVSLTVDGGVITAVEPAHSAPDVYIAPGFIDIQVNGYAGHDMNAPDLAPETVAAMVRALWTRGVTGVCPTVITESEAHICACLEAIAAACRLDPLVERSILGIHVEGPSLSPEDGPRGAHPMAHIRPPSITEYRRWQQAAEGRVRIITLAPEHPGTAAYIRAVTADGVVVSIGHTAADGDQIQAAVAAGARLSTHLGNGAHAQIRRHPNYIWEQLAEDRLTASLICDGHHLPPAVMKTMLRAKTPARAILTSDAVALAAMAPGIYETPVGGKVELLPSGRLNLYGTPYLAGSASSLPDGVANALRHTDAQLADVVRMVSTNPARLLGLEGRGSVSPGAAADLTLFRIGPAGDCIIEESIVGGVSVWRRQG